jgi:Ser/Thr protein kinase RdoA (MazF antagonist)
LVSLGDALLHQPARFQHLERSEAVREGKGCLAAVVIDRLGGRLARLLGADMLDGLDDLAAAIHLYSRGLISQGKGAEIAGLSRWDFIQALGRAEVPACQVTSEELKEEVERAYQAHRQRVAPHSPDQDRAD